VVDLSAVHCVASDDCWAVGGRDNGAVLLHWNGTEWSRSTALNANVPSENLYGLFCVVTDDCWVVGDASGTAATLLHWDGAEWGLVTSTVVNAHYYGISCLTTDDCQAVGQKEGELNIIAWDGTQWSDVSTGIPLNKTLEAVHLTQPTAVIEWSEPVL